MIKLASEIDIIRNIRENLAQKTYGIPFLPEEKLLPALLDAGRAKEAAGR